MRYSKKIAFWNRTYEVAIDPSPPLRQKAQEVKKGAELATLIADMFDTMRASQGIGIAAPQIGEPLRIFVVDPDVFPPDEKRPSHTVFINPILKSKSFKRVPMEEGCLSVPRMYGKVKRPVRVAVEAYDENWNKFRVSASGLFARVLQHELDHLDGALFIDKVEPGTLHEYIPETQEKLT